MKQTLYAKIKIVVETTKEITTQELIDNFEQECDYNIIGTDDIVVLNTEYLETTLNT